MGTSKARAGFNATIQSLVFRGATRIPLATVLMLKRRMRFQNSSFANHKQNKTKQIERNNMSPLLTAWETTADDVANVLRSMGKSEGKAEGIFDELDCEDVAEAALTETDFDEQLNAAYQEIENQIRENNLLISVEG